MYTKRWISLAICLLMLCGMVFSYTLAEGEETDGEGAGETVAEGEGTLADTAEAGILNPAQGEEAALTESAADPDAPVPDFPAANAVDDGTNTVDAALCARVLRAGAGSEPYEQWLRTLAHVPHVGADQKVGRAILKYAVGLNTQKPSGDALYLVTCSEAPLPGNGVDSYVKQYFNLHGAVYSQSPLTSVKVSVRNRAMTGGNYPFEATVSFDASENRTAYAFDEEITVKGELESLDSMMKFNKMKAGKHAITITATTASQTEPVTLYEENFTVLNEKPTLTSNAFRDNYSTALRFFGGDTSKFLMKYTWKSGGKRDIFTDSDWREANIIKGERWRSHVDAAPYFDRADKYLTTTYLRVNIGADQGKVILLDDLLETSATYVPRYQSNLRLISHHTFGTAIDVNDKYGVNLNNTENWAIIAAEAGTNLTYNGIQTDADGKQFYDFTYSGKESNKVNGVPKCIINYLLYELAFYRAGFNWGYYYDHTSDAMHFSLTDGEYYRHMDSEGGLRKVFEYYN